ncbi:hypothetical protein ABIF62_006871 [Bradyrhizobium japonicum]
MKVRPTRPKDPGPIEKLDLPDGLTYPDNGHTMLCRLVQLGMASEQPTRVGEAIMERQTDGRAQFQRVCADAMGKAVHARRDAAVATRTRRRRDEFYQRVTVEQVAFVSHPKIDQAGASPDGLVGADGLVEIKCPNTATHLVGKTVILLPCSKWLSARKRS